MPRAFLGMLKNPRDQLGVRNLLLQSFPTEWKEVLNVFRQAMPRPFGYLLVDLHPAPSDDVRLLSHVLKDEGWTHCYKKGKCSYMKIHSSKLWNVCLEINYER